MIGYKQGAMNLFSSALRDTGRNMLLTWKEQAMTLFTVSLSILIFSFFYLTYINLLHIGSELGDDLRLVVYLDEEPSVPLQNEYRRKITKFDDVEDIRFISSKKAFSRFAEQLDQDSDILLDLPDDFLPPSIEVYPVRNLDTLTRIKRFSDYLHTLPGVLKVQYGKEWIDRFYSFVQLMRLIVILSGLLLIMTTVFMVSHTIRLTLLSRHDELELLRLVGATNNYIRMPFLLEGALQGMAGASLGIISLYFIYSWILLQFSGTALLKGFSVTFLPGTTSSLLTIIATMLCAFGSFSSIKKTLNL